MTAPHALHLYRRVSTVASIGRCPGPCGPRCSRVRRPCPTSCNPLPMGRLGALQEAQHAGRDASHSRSLLRRLPSGPACSIVDSLRSFTILGARRAVGAYPPLVTFEVTLRGSSVPSLRPVPRRAAAITFVIPRCLAEVRAARIRHAKPHRAGREVFHSRSPGLMALRLRGARSHQAAGSPYRGVLAERSGVNTGSR
jgi:hypothetical protein